MAKKTDKRISLKKERFAHEYLIDKCGAHAAIRAGYKPDNAKVTACNLLKEKKVKDRIDQLAAQVAAKTGLTLERLDKEILDMVDAAKQVKIIADGQLLEEKAINFTGLGKALELFGKRIQAFTDVVDHKNSDGSLLEIANAKTKLFGGDIPRTTDK